jgi:hypothetical protein
MEELAKKVGKRAGKAKFHRNKFPRCCTYCSGKDWKERSGVPTESKRLPINI